jgi:peptidoglycan/xylan/chitin deacetylase (PgdA/CDA1 family)
MARLPDTVRRRLRPARRALRERSRRLAHRVAGVRSSLPGLRDVALTFDDGPDPSCTPRLLDLLAALDVRATFFVVGVAAAREPRLVERVVAEGHALGSHSLTHPDPWALSLRALLHEYRGGRHAVEDAAQVPVDLFRPPKGHLDGRGALAARAAGLRTWLWTHDPRDWEPGIAAADLAWVGSALVGGSVVLLHDGLHGPAAAVAADRTATLGALPGIVEDVRRAGLRFVTVAG